MGNVLDCCVKSFKGEKSSEEAKVAAGDGEAKPIYSWDLRKNQDIDPANYCFENLNGETVAKLSGVVNGQSFDIENCKDCVLFVFDHVATLTIDDCENCTIVVGACKGSVFLRDCSDIRLAVCCQQFRSRDCKRVDSYLHCNTQPIIESSVAMRFGCLQMDYTGLKDHFTAAGLSLYNNGWYGIFDFSPVQHGLNYSFLPSTSQITSHLPEDAVSVATDGTVSFSSSPSHVPLTHGLERTPLGDASALFTVFKGKVGTDAQVQTLLGILSSSGCQLRRCKETKMNTDTIHRIFGQDVQPHFIRYAKEGMVIGFEVEGEISTFKAELPSKPKDTDILYILSVQNSSESEVNKFFNYVDMTM